MCSSSLQFQRKSGHMRIDLSGFVFSGLARAWGIQCYIDASMVFSFFFRKRGRTLRASLLLRSRVTLTLGLRRRKRRRRTAARTPVICATRFSRRAALCFDTNMNTQVNTHATFHKAFQRLRLNKHATRNHSLLVGNMSQSLSNRTENGDFFLRNSAEQGGHLHSNRYYSTCTEEDWESVSANFPPLPASRVNRQVLREASSASHFQRLFHWPSSRMTSLVKLAGEFPRDLLHCFKKVMRDHQLIEFHQKPQGES